MGLGQFLPKKQFANSREKSRKHSANENKQPKNGWLVLGVAASVVLMIALVVADVRLIRDPCIAGKIFQQSVSAEVKSSGKTTPRQAVAPGSSETSCYVPPEVTFYTKLSAQDESAGESENHASEECSENDMNRRVKDRATGLEGYNKRDRKVGVVANSNLPSPGLSQKGNLPEPEKGAKVYAVQVGAFTHPAIAQEWALKWKTRGYDVVLKPVARPRTGVIYRLYLGNFLSEKKADELVNRLKSREGISAFPVVLRN
jgi:hypothetical protein